MTTGCTSLKKWYPCSHQTAKPSFWFPESPWALGSDPLWTCGSAPLPWVLRERPVAPAGLLLAASFYLAVESPLKTFVFHYIWQVFHMFVLSYKLESHFAQFQETWNLSWSYIRCTTLWGRGGGVSLPPHLHSSASCRDPARKSVSWWQAGPEVQAHTPHCAWSSSHPGGEDGLGSGGFTPPHPAAQLAKRLCESEKGEVPISQFLKSWELLQIFAEFNDPGEQLSVERPFPFN